METLESLSDALNTTGDIQAIVRTMKALSSVSIRQYEHAEAAMADYARTVELGLMAVLRQRRVAGLPLPDSDRAAGGEALIVIGSDRGLCGGYNDKITRFARSRMGNGPVELGVIGARVAARFEADGMPLAFALHPARFGRGPVAAGAERHRGDRPLDDGKGVGQVCAGAQPSRRPHHGQPQAHRLLPLPDSYLRKLSTRRLAWPVPAALPDGCRPADVVARAATAVRRDLPRAGRGARQRTRLAARGDAGRRTQHRGTARRPDRSFTASAVRRRSRASFWTSCRASRRSARRIERREISLGLTPERPATSFGPKCACPVDRGPPCPSAKAYGPHRAKAARDLAVRHQPDASSSLSSGKNLISAFPNGADRRVAHCSSVVWARTEIRPKSASKRRSLPCVFRRSRTMNPIEAGQ